MEKREKAILIVLLALVSCVAAIGVLGTAMSLTQTNRTMHNVGSVKGIRVGIYWDSACTNQTSSINWGILDPSSNKTMEVYIRNEGNAAATLSKTLQNWTPSNASNCITLNWNYSGQTLRVNQVLQVSLTLAVSSTVSGITSFSFDLTITATG